MGHDLHDEAVVVPLLVRSPGRVPAGRVVEEQVGLVDLAPTLLRLVGETPPSSMQGRSFALPARRRSRRAGQPGRRRRPWLEAGGDALEQARAACVRWRLAHRTVAASAPAPPRADAEWPLRRRDAVV
jgi:arylsulfatase A-like enzyme